MVGLAASVLEFFIEGGRSRSGKVLRPKMGMLSVITNTVLEGQVDDAMVVPVAISYDKVPPSSLSPPLLLFRRRADIGRPTQVIEGEAYKKELLGGQKEPETVAGVIRAARLLKFKFGRVDVNIGTLPRFSPLALVIAHVRGLRFHVPQAMPSPSSSSLPTSTFDINCVLRPDLMTLLRAASYRPSPIGTQLCHLFS